MTHLRQALSTASRYIRPGQNQCQIYRFKTTSNNTNTKKLTSLDQYNKEKQTAKKMRTDQYNKKIARRAGLGTRQDQEKKNYKKNQFKIWFDNMASKQAYLDRQARRQGKQWKINVATMLERLPVVTPDKHQWELDYIYLKAELQRYDDIAYPKELGIPDPMDFEVHTQEELMEMLPKGFTLAPRETEADKSGFIQTLDRQLKTRVYLSICRDKDDDDDAAAATTVTAKSWELPSVTLNENETFLEGAKRATKAVAGDELKFICLSNCPMGVTVNEYISEEDKKANEGFFGEKTFFMRVQYDDGDVDKEKVSKFHDWGWLACDEMAEKVSAEKGDDAALFYKYML